MTSMEQLDFKAKILEKITEIEQWSKRGVCVFTENGDEILYVNQQFCNMFGYSEEELLGQPPKILNDPNAEKSPQAVVKDAIKNTNKYGCFQIIFDNIKKDGTPFWTKSKIVKLEQKNVGAVYLSLQEDITENIILQEKLKDSEEKYRSLIERTNTGYIIMNRELEIHEANKTFLKMIGLKNNSEISGKNPRTWITDNSVKEFDKAFKNVLENLCCVHDLEISFINVQGTIVETAIDASIMENGTFEVFCLIRDISDRKMKEQKKYISGQKKRDRLVQRISAFRETIKE